MLIKSDSFITGRYNGQLGEVVIYHMAIIDTSEIVKCFQTTVTEIMAEIGIKHFETDIACSWCICESVKRAFPEIVVLNHELNTTYESVYDVFFTGVEFSLRNKLLPYLQTKNPVKLLKVMPMLDRTIIAIGT